MKNNFDDSEHKNRPLLDSELDAVTGGQILFSTDRTFELEQRLKAIRINGNDCCSFFQGKDSNSMTLRSCSHCIHSQFGVYDSELTDGLCKFKPSVLK